MAKKKNDGSPAGPTPDEETVTGQAEETPGKSQNENGGAEADPPPAAQTVIEGERTEREINLQAELDAERAAREAAERGLQESQETIRQRETRLAELEDENHSLKDALKPPPKSETKPLESPEPPKPPKPAAPKQSDGWGFF